MQLPRCSSLRYVQRYVHGLVSSSAHVNRGQSAPALQRRRNSPHGLKGRDNIGIIEEEDDEDVVQATYRQAFQNSQPETVCVPGLQEFAGAIWDRRKHIPSSGSDPLEHIFMEFDTDHDGYLDAEDVVSALSSRQVQITPEQAQLFLEVSDIDHDHKVGRHEFPDFIFHMAAADLAHQDPIPSLQIVRAKASGGGSAFDEQQTVSSSVEAGDLARGLKAWLKLTNNMYAFGSEDLCATEDDDSKTDASPS